MPTSAASDKKHKMVDDILGELSSEDVIHDALSKTGLDFHVVDCEFTEGVSASDFVEALGHEEYVKALHTLDTFMKKAFGIVEMQDVASAINKVMPILEAQLENNK